ncbi:MAG TPA: ATP-binding protein, partial [Polyangia bacterium]
TADWFQVGHDALVEDVMPREMLLDQMPRRLSMNKQTWSIAYRPILSQTGDKIEKLLLVLSDITDELVRERMERDSREMTRIFQRVTSDRGGAEQFFEEAEGLVAKITAAHSSPEMEARLIHTLKGNCALFGIESMSQICHNIESNLVADGRSTNESERRRIADHWMHISELTSAIRGERRSTIELEEVDLLELVKAINAGAPHNELVAIAESWRHEPVGLRFARLADKAVYLARRLGKPAVTVHTETSGIRLDANRWAPFWSALVHAVNNAVDHGIEDPEAREAQGKPPAGTLWLAVRREGSDMVLSLRDDGRGIDWKRLAEKGAERGMPTQSLAQLIDVMCTDGVSTSNGVTGTSGRGVGLAALREATITLGGRMGVDSEAGKGTTFVFRFSGT